MRVDRLHGILEFGAALPNKRAIRLFWCDCKETPSPEEGSTAKHIQQVDKLGQAARPPAVCGSFLGLEKQIFFVLV
jgi:hypothetical protein